MEGYETKVENKRFNIVNPRFICTFLMDTLAWNRIKCLYQVRKELL